MRLAGVEAVVKVPLAPRRRLDRHLRHGTQGTAHGPDRAGDDQEEGGRREDRRGDKRSGGRSLIRLQREPGDDGAHAAAGPHHGHRVQPRVGGGLVGEAGRPPGKRTRDPLDGCGTARLLDHPSSRVDPDLGIDRSLVGSLCRVDLTVPHRQRVEGGRSPAQEHLVGVVVEARVEREVEPHGECRERQRGPDRDDDREPPSKAQPAHRSWYPTP